MHSMYMCLCKATIFSGAPAVDLFQMHICFMCVCICDRPNIIYLIIIFPINNHAYTKMEERTRAEEGAEQKTEVLGNNFFLFWI